MKVICTRDSPVNASAPNIRCWTDARHELGFDSAVQLLNLGSPLILTASRLSILMNFVFDWLSRHSPQKGHKVGCALIPNSPRRLDRLRTNTNIPFYSQRWTPHGRRSTREKVHESRHERVNTQKPKVTITSLAVCISPAGPCKKVLPIFSASTCKFVSIFRAQIGLPDLPDGWRWEGGEGEGEACARKTFCLPGTQACMMRTLSRFLRSCCPPRTAHRQLRCIFLLLVFPRLFGTHQM